MGFQLGGGAAINSRVFWECLHLIRLVYGLCISFCLIMLCTFKIRIQFEFFRIPFHLVKQVLKKIRVSVILFCVFRVHLY